MRIHDFKSRRSTAPVISDGVNFPIALHVEMTHRQSHLAVWAHEKSVGTQDGTIIIVEQRPEAHTELV
ncbi:MAG: hypothetical protein DMG31_01255 [Acidobacteria bacterium]|nr:MAG: hypothetical protein DMG31_01255 [Acidobacteriota bacterium]